MTFAVPHQHGSEAPPFPAFNGGLRDLFSTLDDLLSCGGDPRLMLDPISRLNDYGCGPAPLPQILSFASSTASSISTGSMQTFPPPWSTRTARTATS